MNLSELDANYERRIIVAHHLSGAFTLIVTLPVLFLIVTGDDSRSKHYRKYLCYLVISSLAYDQCYDNYAAIILINKGLLYSDSLMCRVISAAPFFAFAEMTFTQVIVSYFACVYYRRSPNRCFNNFEWKRMALYLFVQMYTLTAQSAKLLFYYKTWKASENLLPIEYYCVKARTTYLFVQEDEYMEYANYVGNIAGGMIAVSAMAMLIQLIIEVKKGLPNSSDAMNHYHKLAVRALILQGVVPSLTYAVPACINTVLEIFVKEENVDRVATLLSPISVLILTKHTLVNSLTILACSPSYRRRIVAGLASILHKIIPPGRVDSSTNGST